MSTVDPKNASYATLIVLTMVLVSDDTITFGTTESSSLFMLKCLIYLALLLAIPVMAKTNALTLSRTGYLSLVIASIFLTFIVNNDITGGYAYQIWILTLAFLIVDSVDISVFVPTYSRILYVLSVISILLFTIATSFGWVLNSLPVFENTSGVRYVNLFLGAIYIDRLDVRNMGIFREPGVFMTYLLIGIIIELYFYTRINVKRLFVYLIALFTTFSTAAFFVLSLLMLGYLFKKGMVSLKFKLLMVVFALAIVVVLYKYPETYSRIFSKLDEDSVDYLSTIAREASVSVNFKIFIDNFFFGTGLNPYVDLFESYSVERYGIALKAGSHSSNTYMSTFATYGVVYGSILVWGIYNFSKLFTLTYMSRMVLFLSLLLMFSNEDMRYSIFFNVLVFYGLQFVANNTAYRSQSYRVV